MTRFFLIFIIGISSLYTNNLLAQKQQKPPVTKKVFYSLGASVALFPEYEGSKDYRVLPFISFSANWINGRYIRVYGLNAEYNVLANRKWNFGPMIASKINRNNSVSNTKIAQLPEIDFAVGAGLFAKYNFKKVDIKASYTHDITGANDGGLANVEVGFNHRKKKLISRVAINSSFATSNYLNTYFGVSQTSSLAANLPSYKLKSGFKDVGVSSNVFYLLNKKWMLGMAFRYNVFISDVVDSPIIQTGNKHQFVTAISALYRF